MQFLISALPWFWYGLMVILGAWAIIWPDRAAEATRLWLVRYCKALGYEVDLRTTPRALKQIRIFNVIMLFVAFWVLWFAIKIMSR